MAILTFNTKVHFGHGERKQLMLESTKLGMNRPLFVTDKGVRAAGVFAQATETLNMMAEAVIFDQTPPNPTEDAAAAGLTAYQANNCDGIIGIGGGATLDLAKAIAVLCGDPAPLSPGADGSHSGRPTHDPPRREPEKRGRVAPLPPMLLAPRRTRRNSVSDVESMFVT